MISSAREIALSEQCDPCHKRSMETCMKHFDKPVSIHPTPTSNRKFCRAPEVKPASWQTICKRHYKGSTQTACTKWPSLFPLSQNANLTSPTLMGGLGVENVRILLQLVAKTTENFAATMQPLVLQINYYVSLHSLIFHDKPVSIHPPPSTHAQPIAVQVLPGARSQQLGEPFADD